MKFPDVTKLGAVNIEGVGAFLILMVNEEWEPDLGRHDSDHATGGCVCPCWPPLPVIEEAATEDRP